jgi:phospholipase/carboxylesterase
MLNIKVWTMSLGCWMAATFTICVLGGVIALSTYLPMPQRLVGEATPAARGQPVFMAHGQYDPVVPYAGGEASARLLRDLGLPVDWHAYPMAHQVCGEEIRDLGDWISPRLA